MRLKASSIKLRRTTRAQPVQFQQAMLDVAVFGQMRRRGTFAGQTNHLVQGMSVAKLRIQLLAELAGAARAKFKPFLSEYLINVFHVHWTPSGNETNGDSPQCSQRQRTRIPQYSGGAVLLQRPSFHKPKIVEIFHSMVGRDRHPSPHEKEISGKIAGEPTIPSWRLP
jgi:hypothetical protein